MASFGVSENSLERLGRLTIPVHLGIYKVNNYERLKNNIVKTARENNIDVRGIHLPIDCLRYSLQKVREIIMFFRAELGCSKFVIHPNKNIVKFIPFFLNNCYGIELCIENFQWKRKKPFRSPLEIYEVCLQSDFLKMTFDTSHAEEIWFDHKVFSFFAHKVSVVHLSNRSGKEQHKPFNCGDGELNLVSFVKVLKRNFNWSGDIVLEYMPEYFDKVYQNLSYLERLLE